MVSLCIVINFIKVKMISFFFFFWREGRVREGKGKIYIILYSPGLVLLLTSTLCISMRDLTSVV